ncbi:MAG: IclR family transcriptional regulator C-terminal domain-containing protein [Acidihalobacter sp.]
MLSVLDLFDPQHLRMDPDLIAERMGLSRATVYRYVRDLRAAGLLSRIDAGSYGLGPRIIELDWMMRLYDPILVAGRDLMHTLSKQTGLAVFASVFYDDRIINTYIAEPKDTYHFAFGRGHPLPLFRGAQSKVLVSYQKGRKLKQLYEEKISQSHDNTLSWKEFSRATRKIRKDGYCITHDELNLGFTGIATPIISIDEQEVVGSLSAVGTEAHFKLLRLETVIDMLVETTQRIAANILTQNKTDEMAPEAGASGDST